MASPKILPFGLLPALLLISLWATPTLAAPKYVVTGRCLCWCDVGGTDPQVYDGMGATCDSFNDKTCNVQDPQTGGVRSGRLKACQEECTREGGARKVPKTKVQPKITPGGAEQPSGTTPSVRPKSPIQQQP